LSNRSGCGTVIALLLGAFLLTRCLHGGGSRDSDEPAASAAHASEEEIEDRAADAASDAVAGTTYSDQGAPYGCTDDCSGHEAGYKWAEDKEITDPDDCGGDSNSFREGCVAYAEAYQQAKEEAADEARDNAAE
jgi:hypothetical protein